MYSFKCFKVLSLLVFLSLSPIGALAGPGGTGGGNALLSTPEQVEKLINLVKPKLIEWLKVYQIRFHSITSEASISKLYNKFYQVKLGTDTAVSIWSIENSPFIIKKDGPCIDMKGNQKDAAVQDMLEPGSPICLSVSRLTRIPPDQLERQIVALVAHELTHQIMRSLDEGWPENIQVEVLDTYSRALGKETVCEVRTFKKSSGEVTGYQINFGYLLDCSGGCSTGLTFNKDELGKYLELARGKHLDPLGRLIGCTTFKFTEN